METITTIALALFVSLVVGLLLSLLILLPPLRQWAQHSPIRRQISMFTFGSLVYLIVFVAQIGLNVSITYQLGTYLLIDQGHTADEAGNISGRASDEALRIALEANRRAILGELWLHHLNAFAANARCLTENSTVCELADRLNETMGWSNSSAETGLLATLILSLAAASVSMGCVWFLTQPKP